MDSVILRNVRVRTRIGVPEEERKSPQELTVSVELLHPLEAVARSDYPASGIDYALVVTAIEKLALLERRTIERFAEDIADALLKQFRPEGGVHVTVEKHPALPVDAAAVTILRVPRS